MCVCVFITFYTLYSVHIHVTSVISYDGACFFHYRQVSVYCNTDLGSLMLDAGIITSLQNNKSFVYETSCVVLMRYIDKEGQLCNTSFEYMYLRDHCQKINPTSVFTVNVHHTM